MNSMLQLFTIYKLKPFKFPFSKRNNIQDRIYNGTLTIVYNDILYHLESDIILYNYKILQ